MVLKFFDVVLKFELPRARCLNIPKNSASVLIRLVLIIGDCLYYNYLVLQNEGTVERLKYSTNIEILKSIPDSELLT